MWLYYSADVETKCNTNFPYIYKPSVLLCKFFKLVVFVDVSYSVADIFKASMTNSNFVASQ